MNIVVCIKQIIDPEVHPRDFKIDSASKKQVQGKSSLVISPFDENAIEMSLQLKARTDGRVTVLSMGGNSASDALRKAVAMGVDEAQLLSDELFSNLDSFGTAKVLSAAINKLGQVDLVLCGRQAGDRDMGLVGGLLAENLDVPCVNFVFEIAVSDGKLNMKRQEEDGLAIIETPIPALATITNDEALVPRLAKVKDLLKASRKEIPVLSASALGLSQADLEDKTEVRELFIPVREGKCEIIEGDSLDDKAANLTRRMRELKIL